MLAPSRSCRPPVVCPGTRAVTNFCPRFALELRQEMYEHACVAPAALGPPPLAMGQSEADLRTFIHDPVHRDHDKDYRSPAAFPPKSAEHLACHILRVSHRGVYLGETVCGWDFDETASPHVWLLVHCGHMRLLIPPGFAKGADLRRAPDCDMGFAQIYAARCEAHLLAGISDPPSVLAEALESCPRCPSACLDFHSWRTSLETHAFGRAPSPEFKIGAEPVRAVVATWAAQRSATLSFNSGYVGSPPVATRPPSSLTASGTVATSLKFWVAPAGLFKP